MRQYRHQTAGEYLEAQKATYERKKDMVWLQPHHADVIAEQIHEEDLAQAAGICHGVRSGAELGMLSRRLDLPHVIGTEIARGYHVADWNLRRRPVLKWDMRKPYDDWRGRFGWVYSNSLDHSNDPLMTVEVWMDQLVPGGLLVVHWSPGHDHPRGPDAADCTMATLDEYVEIVAKAANNVRTVGAVENLKMIDHVLVLARRMT